MRDFYKMKTEYSLQPWYNEDPHELIYVHSDRTMSNFGTDCKWENFYTKKTVSNWDKVFRKITESEKKEIIRNYNLYELFEK
jgi:hypothetical protein